MFGAFDQSSMYHHHRKQNHPEWNSYSTWNQRYPQCPLPHRTPPAHAYGHHQRAPPPPPPTAMAHLTHNPRHVASHAPPPPSPAYYASTPRRGGHSSEAPHHVASMPIVSPPQQQLTPNSHSPRSPHNDHTAKDSLIDGVNNTPNPSAITTKPPRPYTEYTMFYQLEREYILHRLLADEDEQAESQKKHVALFKNDPLMPARYRDLPLRADWYISGKSKKPTKRKHRKSHGKIGFLELTRMIAARWAKVDDETKKYCKMMAAMELVKYKEDMETYNQYKEELSAIGEVPEELKEKENKKKKSTAKKSAKQQNTDGDNLEKVTAPIITSSKKFPEKNEKELVTLAKKSSPIKADHVGSRVTYPSKVEPIAHDANDKSNLLGNKLDNDMEKFITALVAEEQENEVPSRASLSTNYNCDELHSNLWENFEPPKKQTRTSPRRPHRSISVTPERIGHRRAVSTNEHSEEYMVNTNNPSSDEANKAIRPQDRSEMEPPMMRFDAIDESEIAREFYGHDQAAGAHIGMPGQSFDPFVDYWDELVGPNGLLR
mmetsp:Transcript_31060/g.63913  ORF Transcript_31060/g.63913 Transcript_31060/m.63913 type:complete len:545 (-) Transcript_31060:153-1787(-)